MRHTALTERRGPRYPAAARCVMAVTRTDPYAAPAPPRFSRSARADRPARRPIWDATITPAGLMVSQPAPAAAAARRARPDDETWPRPGPIPGRGRGALCARAGARPTPASSADLWGPRLSHRRRPRRLAGSNPPGSVQGRSMLSQLQMRPRQAARRPCS